MKWDFKTPGIPDNFFVKGAPITKEEVRVITLSKARIKENSTIYDVGAGTGSISIEAALLARNGKVFSIEKNPERISLIKKNIKKFGVSNIEVVEGEAPEVLRALPRADRIIIGGSGGRIRRILKKCDGKLNDNGVVVINAVKLDTLRDSTSTLQKLSYNFRVTQVHINKFDGIAKALSTIFIIDAEKR